MDHQVQNGEKPPELQPLMTSPVPNMHPSMPPLPEVPAVHPWPGMLGDMSGGMNFPLGAFPYATSAGLPLVSSAGLPFGLSAGLPLSASLLASPNTFLRFTFPEDPPQPDGQKSNANLGLEQQAQMILSELRDKANYSASQTATTPTISGMHTIPTIPTMTQMPFQPFMPLPLFSTPPGPFMTPLPQVADQLMPEFHGQLLPPPPKVSSRTSQQRTGSTGASTATTATTTTTTRTATTTSTQRPRRSTSLDTPTSAQPTKPKNAATTSTSTRALRSTNAGSRVDSKKNAPVSEDDGDDDDEEEDSESDDDTGSDSEDRSESVASEAYKTKGKTSTPASSAYTANRTATDKKPAPKKRKRISNKKEPLRDEFASEEQYKAAWARWREIRNNNNDSVKRSRENARQRKMNHEQLCEERARENAQLEQVVKQLRKEVTFLTKVLNNPGTLDNADRTLLAQMLHAPQD